MININKYKNVNNDVIMMYNVVNINKYLDLKIAIMKMKIYLI